MEEFGRRLLLIIKNQFFPLLNLADVNMYKINNNNITQSKLNNFFFGFWLFCCCLEFHSDLFFFVFVIAIIDSCFGEYIFSL